MKKLKRISLILTSLVGTMIISGCSIGTNENTTSSTVSPTTTSDVVTTSDDTSKYNFKEFEWADDFSSASLVLTNGKEDLRISAKISTNSLSPSCTKEGLITYTASATYDRKEYKDIKTKTIEKISHDYDVNNIKWDWADDFSSASATIKCKNCDDEKVLVATITSNTVDATATTSGKITYTAKITFNNQEYNDIKEKIIPATGYIYDYDNITYNWNESYTSVSVIVPCTNAEDADLNLTTTDITELSRTPSTCTTKGSVTYEASITIGDNVYKNQKVVELELDNHDYDVNNIKWDWAVDYSTAKAKIKCKNCIDEKEIIASISVFNKDATATETGKTTYTAKITFEGNEYTNVKEIIIPATGYIYDYENISYVWNDTYTSVEVTVPCTNASNADLVINSTNITEVSKTPSTCTVKGSVTYRVSIELNNNTYTNDKTVELDLASHEYDVENILWIWAADYSTAKASIKCKNCEDKKEVVASISVVNIAPTATATGKTTYTAKITFEGNEYTNVKEIIIPAEGYKYDYENITYKWNEDYTSVEVTVPCTNASNSDLVINSTNITEISKTPSTCVTKGKIIYQVSVEINNNTYTNNKEKELDLADHDYNAPTYVWNSDYSKCTATRICKVNSNHKDIEEANSTYSVITAPTYTSAGLGRYSVEFNNNAFEKQTYDVVIPKLEYSWNNPTYSWNSDNTKVTATRIAKEDNTVIETETVNVTYSVKTEAKCETDGVGLYTSAEFNNKAFSVQTKEITLPMLDHDFDYDNVTWVWTGYNSCVAQIKCKRCNKVESYNAIITSVSTATCESAGIKTYTAKATIKGTVYTDTKEENVAALGHNYGTPTYTWNADYSKCTATVVCLNDSSHKITETVNTTTDIVLATKTTIGYKKYSVTFNDSHFSKQEKNINLYYLEFLDNDGNAVRLSDAGKVVASGGKQQIFYNVEEGGNILTIDGYNTVAKVNSKPRISTDSNPLLTYVFRGWLDGDTLITNINTYKVTKNTTLRPKYVKYEINKTIDASCEVTGFGSDYYNYNMTSGIDIQEVYDGYMFEGIYKIINGTRTKIHTATNYLTYEAVTFTDEFDTVFEIKYLPIPISITTGSGGSVNYTKKSWVGGTFEASAITSSGYSFKGFYNSNDELVYKDSNNLPEKSFSVTLTTDLDNITYTAKWVKSNINVSISEDGAGTLSGYDGTSILGETKTITAIPASGYTFVRWTKNGSQISTSESINILFDESTANYVAEFKSYTLTTSTNDLSAGTIPTYNNKKVAVGENVTLNITLNEGYTFLGWYDENDNLIPGTKGNLNYSFVMPKSDLSYKAIFEKYTLTTTNLNPEYGTINTNYNLKAVTAGTNVSLTVAPKKGYTFLGWYYNDELLIGSNITTYVFTMPEANIEYKAKFIAYTITANSENNDKGTVVGYSESNMVTVTFNTMGGNTISSQIVTNEDPITYPDLVLKDGYVFNGWYTDVDCTLEFDFTSTIESNITLYAGYKKMLTSDVKESYVADIARDYKTASSYYRLSLESTSSTSKNNVYFTSYVDGNIDLYFRSPNSKVCYITIINITTGETIKNVSEANPNFSNLYTELSVNKYDVICLSCYSDDDCNLDMYAIGNTLPEASGLCGYISYATATNITAGNIVSLKAIQKPGYTFVGWYKNGEETPVSTSLTYEYQMINQNVTFEAKFNYYTVTLTGEYKNNDLSAGSLVNEYNNTKITVGDKVELRATLAEGYTFKGWFINGNTTPISTSLEYDYTMVAQNVNIVAKYTYYLVTIETNNINAGTVGGVSDGNYVVVSFETNGAIENYDSQIVKANTTITYPGNPTKVGYIFKGWYSNSLCTEFFDFDSMLLNNVTLYAGYYQIPTNDYDVLDLTIEAYNNETAKSVTGLGTESIGSHYSYFTVTKSGTYRIYYKNSASSTVLRTGYTIYNVTTNTIYADGSTANLEYKYKDIEANKGDVIYIQSFSYDGFKPTFTYYINILNSNNTPERVLDPTPTVICGPLKYNNTKIKEGTEITLTATLNEGYTFDGWYQYNDETGQYDIKLTSNLTYKVIIGEEELVKYKAMYNSL